MNTKKIKNIIESNPLALSTIGDDKPYVIGVAFCKMIDDKTILITNNFMRITVENILKNNNVAMVVWDKKLQGIQILGKAEYYSEGKWLDCVKKIKENKGLPARGAILVKIMKTIESK